YPNGIEGSQQYDANRLSGARYQNRGGQALAAWTLQYDAAGNVVEKRPDGGSPLRYQYDASGQLTAELSSDGETRRSYVPGGNVAEIVRGGASLGYEYDSGDRLIRAGNDQFSYDAAGNLSRGREGARYEYDVDNRLVKVTKSD